MKLLKPESRLWESGGGNVKTQTALGDALLLWSSDRGSTPLGSTTVRLKTNVFRRFFYVNDQNRARSDPKSRKKEGAPPQNSAIFLILGIAVLR